VEIDAFAELVFRTFEELRQEKEKNVFDLFAAADIQVSGSLDLDEFQIICYHLTKQNSEQSAHLFVQYAQDLDNEGLCIDIENFARIALEKNFFSQKAQ